MCSNDIVMFRAGEEGMAMINRPRTTGLLSHAHLKPEQAQEGRDWISELRLEEEYISNAGEFYNMLDASKVVHIVTDGEARPNPAAAGWGALVRQNKAFTMM
jgi:hypothetical protein